MTVPWAPLPPTVPLQVPLPGARFTEAVYRFFAKYAVFSGRASRAEYWWATLFVVLVGLVIFFAGAGLGAVTTTPSDMRASGGVVFNTFAIIDGLFALAVLIPSTAIGIRRLHDANVAAKGYLIVFLPYVGPMILLLVCLLPSNPAGSRFDPRRTGGSDGAATTQPAA